MALMSKMIKLIFIFNRRNAGNMRQRRATTQDEVLVKDSIRPFPERSDDNTRARSENQNLVCVRLILCAIRLALPKSVQSIDTIAKLVWLGFEIVPDGPLGT